MTEQHNPEETTAPETFVVGEWAELYEGKSHRKAQITAVNGVEVTARVHGKPMTFAPRVSDGKMVKKGSPDYEVRPTMIRWIAPGEKLKITWRDVRDFLLGMFLAPWSS